MIEIKDWFVRVPNSEYQIGYHGEHMVHRLSFRLLDAGYEDWTFKLDVKQDDKHDTLALEKRKTPDGFLLGTDVHRNLLTFPGVITTQIRAFNDLGQERHTNQFFFAVMDSIRPDEGLSTPLPSEFYQMEQVMSKILDEAETAAKTAQDAANQVDMTAIDEHLAAKDEHVSPEDRARWNSGGGGGGGSGTDGLSAYEVAVKNGFSGSETEWLASLKGADGTDGAKGEPGADGAPGKDGEPGKDGAPGKDGEAGPQGPRGAPGTGSTSAYATTLMKTGWVKSAVSATGTYWYEYTVPFPDLAADDLINVQPIDDTYSRVFGSMIRAYVETFDGEFKLFASKIPTVDLPIYYVVYKKEVS